MNRPSLLVRVAGSPVPAVLLLLICASVVLGWYQGEVVWWLAVGAVGAAVRTLSAVGKVRRYKAWRADWEAMGATSEQVRPSRKRRGRWLLVTAASLFLAIPAYLPQVQDNQGLSRALVWLWCVAALYLVFRMMRAVLLRARNRRRKKAETAPVAWLLGRASSSPSRAEAQENLPEYCARLIAPGEGTRESFLRSRSTS